MARQKHLAHGRWSAQCIEAAPSVRHDEDQTSPVDQYFRDLAEPADHIGHVFDYMRCDDPAERRRLTDCLGKRPGTVGPDDDEVRRDDRIHWNGVVPGVILPELLDVVDVHVLHVAVGLSNDWVEERSDLEAAPVGGVEQLKEPLVPYTTIFVVHSGPVLRVDELGHCGMLRRAA